MKFIKEKGEWVVALVVVLACAAWIVSGLQPPKDGTVQEIRDNGDKIKSALETNAVAANWDWASSKQEKHAAVLQIALARPSNLPGSVGTPFAFYPQPQRPFVHKDEVDGPTINLTRVQAVLSPPDGMSAKADHGSVYLSFKLPVLKLFDPVRIEILRCDTADGEFKLLGKVEMAPEEVPLAGMLGPEKEPEEKHTELPPSRYDELGNRVDAKARDAAPDVKKVEIPEEYKSLIVFRDMEVQPKKMYFYKAALIARKHPVDSNNLIKAGKDVLLVENYNAFADVKPTKEGSQVKLASSVHSALVSDLTPPNFEVRFAGTIGELPKDDEVFPPGYVHTYKGNFAVKVWISALRKWEETTLQIPFGGEIKGQLRYKKPDTKENEFLDFATGIKLVEILRKDERVMKVTRRQKTIKKTTADGEEVEEPVMDKHGRPVTEEINIEQKMPSEVAVLYDSERKKSEELFKRGDFERKKDQFLYFENILKQQEELRTKEKARRDKFLVELEARRKKEAANLQQPVPEMPPDMGPGGPGMDGMPGEGQHRQKPPDF